MKVCFPVAQDNGLASEVYGHFGSAPCFIIADSGTGQVQSISNKDQHHAHGQCNPLRALDGQEVHAVVVGGIGRGALMRLNQGGIKVFKANAGSVEDNLKHFIQGSLPVMSPGLVCVGHGHGHGGGCSH